jgi:hypothetical protein
VLFPAIFSYASRQSNELAPPFVVELPEKKTKKAAKTMLVIHDESDILWLFNILGSRGKDSHDPDTQAHSTLSGVSCRQVWGRSSSPVPDFPPV